MLNRSGLVTAALPPDPYPIDAPLNISRNYARGWSGDALSIIEPFIEPEDLIQESYASPRPQRHWVRVDEIGFDDEVWPMLMENFRFPIGAAMAQGSQEPLDDYRVIYDGAHA